MARDWVEVAQRFNATIGFEMTDIAIPGDLQHGESKPQVRACRILDDSALPLPPYAREGFKIYPYTGAHSLIVLDRAIATMKENARTQGR